MRLLFFARAILKEIKARNQRKLDSYIRDTLLIIFYIFESDI